MQFNKKMASNKEWMSMGWNSLFGMLGSYKAYRKVFKQVLTNYYRGYYELQLNENFYNKIHSEPINKTRKEISIYKPLPELSAPGFPIIITYGDNDIYSVSKEMLPKRFPTAEVITLQKSGHIPWKQNYNEFEEILNNFYSIE